jgi:hypothetical protein
MTSGSNTIACAATLVTFIGCSAASACDVGNIQCDNAGYRYECRCYNDGCNYYPDGTCASYHLPFDHRAHTTDINYTIRPGFAPKGSLIVSSLAQRM